MGAVLVVLSIVICVTDACLIHLLMKAMQESFVSASPLPTWMGGDNEYLLVRDLE